MTMHLQVHFLPQPNTSTEVAGRTVVVIDILRATTTMLHALWSGAREVIPCLEVDEARNVAQQFDGTAILGGERGGKRIPGFTLGNSPAEYTPQTVGGKTIVMTTTNGTRALQACRGAARVLIGAFVNFSRVVAELERVEKVSLLCAGTNGRVTREDVLFAGAVVHALRRNGIENNNVDDEAELAAAAWESSVGNVTAWDPLRSALTASRGGRNLVELGFDSDIVLSAQVDARPILGELVLDQWRIVSGPDART